jgi:hypothetical protein
MELPERFKGVEWIKNSELKEGHIKFKLRDYDDVVGIQRFQKWNNEAKRYEDADQFTKGRNEGWIRQVVVNGTEKNVQITKTANDVFRQILETLRVAGKDPLQQEFEIWKEGEGLQTKTYIKPL